MADITNEQRAALSRFGVSPQVIAQLSSTEAQERLKSERAKALKKNEYPDMGDLRVEADGTVMSFDKTRKPKDEKKEEAPVSDRVKSFVERIFGAAADGKRLSDDEFQAEIDKLGKDDANNKAALSPAQAERAAAEQDGDLLAPPPDPDNAAAPRAGFIGRLPAPDAAPQAAPEEEPVADFSQDLGTPMPQEGNVPVPGAKPAQPSAQQGMVSPRPGGNVPVPEPKPEQMPQDGWDQDDMMNMFNAMQKYGVDGFVHQGRQYVRNPEMPSGYALEEQPEQAPGPMAPAQGETFGGPYRDENGGAPMPAANPRPQAAPLPTSSQENPVRGFMQPRQGGFY
jgi:hypothetical protein